MRGRRSAAGGGAVHPFRSSLGGGLVYEHVVCLLEIGRAHYAGHLRLAVPSLLGDVLLLLRRISTNREHDCVVATLVTGIWAFGHCRVPFSWWVQVGPRPSSILPFSISSVASISSTPSTRSTPSTSSTASTPSIPSVPHSFHCFHHSTSLLPRPGIMEGVEAWRDGGLGRDKVCLYIIIGVAPPVYLNVE